MLNPYPYAKYGLKAFLLFIFLFVLTSSFCQVKSSRFIIKTDTLVKEINKTLRSSRVINNDVLPPITAPIISYQTPQNYVLNQAISPLTPVNSGGDVPAGIYNYVSTFAGIHHPGFTNGTSTTASFNQPRDVTVDLSGNTYIIDDNNVIRKVSPGGVVTTFAGTGALGNTNGPGSSATFRNMLGIITDASGNIYVTDSNNNMIRKITPNGVVSTLAGNGTIGAVNGPGSMASFNSPFGIGIDGSGNLYVADMFNNMIRKVTPAGVVSTVAGNGSYGSLDGTGAAANFSQPEDVVVDAAGNLFVADAGNNKIRKITPSGVVTTFAGNGTVGKADGTGTAASFYFPCAITFCSGNFYLDDPFNQIIRKITPDGVVTTIAGQTDGSLNNYGDVDGVGRSAKFSYPYGIGTDGTNIYIADNQNNDIRKLSLTGYTIDKPLPAGLTFDQTTGIISGTPTVLSPATNYTITAYNGAGSSTTVVNLAVGLTPVLKPSIITLPPQQPKLDASDNYDPMATSTNNETPITYISSNPSVATITSNGLVHVIAPGVTIITANQQGDANYTAAIPVQQTLTVIEQLSVSLPDIAVKTVCDVDFSANAMAPETKIPITYSSSDPSVATISAQGIIHIVGIGSTIITAYQNADPPLYISATPQSKVLTVTTPVIPIVSISDVYTGQCIGSPVTFTADITNGGANPICQWAINGVNTGSNNKSFTSSTFADGDVVTCTCTNTDNTCISGYAASSNPVTVNLVTPSTPSLSIAASATSVFFGEPVTFTATVRNVNGAVAYQWQINGNNVGDGTSTFTSKSLYNGDIITCAIVPSVACSAPATSNPIKITIITQLGIPNAFTPNGDGINDTWNISGIVDYPDCLVNIYNRYGLLIFHSKGYSQPWDGTFNGAKVPVATYYYVINLGYQDKKVSGDITVIR